MNRHLPFLFSLLSLAACQSNKQPEAPMVQVKSAAAVADPLTLKLDALKKLPQIDLAELGTYLPEVLNDVKRSNFNMTSNMGYAVAQADYEKGKKSSVHVIAYDCAGEAGANLYQSSYAGKLNNDHSNEAAYTKTISFNGNKAIESFTKENNLTTLTYMANDRVLIIISGRALNGEEVKRAAAQIKK